MIAAALEHVDQAPGARVADAQAALDHRDRGGARSRPRPAPPAPAGRPGRERTRRRRRPRPRARLASSSSSSNSGSPCSAQCSVICAISSSVTKAPWIRCSFEVPAGAEEHVALAEQALGAALVEDHARVDLRGDGERDPRRDVDLDRAGDDVRRRALGREQQVDADGARLLGEADDRVLDLGRGDHHQVGELVDHAEDVRAAAPRPCACGRLFSSARLRARALPITS